MATEPIVQRLAALIQGHGWAPRFQQAMDCAAAQEVEQVAHIRSLDDYLRYIDDMVRWAPRESGDSRLVHDKLVEFHFFLDQPPLRALQSPIVPGAGIQALTPLSQWIVDFAVAWGTSTAREAELEMLCGVEQHSLQGAQVGRCCRT